jgi:hypothetical protein
MELFGLQILMVHLLKYTRNMKTISADQFKKQYGEDIAIQLSSNVGKIQKGFLERTKEAAGAGVSKIGEAFRESQEGKFPLSTGAKFGAGVIETVFSPLTAVVEPAIKPTLGKAIEFGVEQISDIPEVQEFAMSNAGEVTERIAEDIGNLNAILAAATLQRAPKVGADVVRTTEAGADVIKGGVDKALQPVRGVVEGTRDVVGMVAEEAQRLPTRIATNVAEKQAVRQMIQQLPTKIARQAAQDGLDILDIQKLYKIPASQKAPLKTLANTVKDFIQGKTTTNPIEIVGKPIVSRIKELESARGTIGQKLGKAAENLGKVTSQETSTAVFEALRKVQGLSGLKVSARGVLDFRDTVLASALSKADQVVIQKIFNQAIKAGTGRSKHLLRQELFEILGGKKKSLANLTATQEQAFNAIRKGLSDVLESKNSLYKDLSNQYRKVAQPLQEIRSYMKKVVGAEEDILDMSAGLLARRLTSAAKSNPEIRNVLNAMDKATTVAGKTRLSVETLQDFYNILEKYYDIAPKTGFQAQVRQGVEKATGITDFAFQQIKGFAGETPVVRQKALEKILEEILK